jgi:hypothetical protein
MKSWCSDCTGLNWRCSEPSSSTSRSPPIDLPCTSRKIGTHPTINHVFALSTNQVPQFYYLLDFGNIGTKLEHFKELQRNQEFYQHKCHPGNTPDTRRLCAKDTNMWAQWVAGRPAPLCSLPWVSLVVTLSKRWWNGTRGLESVEAAPDGQPCG